MRSQRHAGNGANRSAPKVQQGDVPAVIDTPGLDQSITVAESELNRAKANLALAIRDRVARYKAMDPNFGLTDAFGFTLAAAGGNAGSGVALDMAKLKGKTLVVISGRRGADPALRSIR